MLREAECARRMEDIRWSVEPAWWRRGWRSLGDMVESEFRVEKLGFVGTLFTFEGGEEGGFVFVGGQGCVSAFSDLSSVPAWIVSVGRG